MTLTEAISLNTVLSLKQLSGGGCTAGTGVISILEEPCTPLCGSLLLVVMTDTFHGLDSGETAWA